MRVVFMGSDRWSVPALVALASAGNDIRLVVTRTPKPAGRGSEITSTPVAERARAMRAEVFETDRISDWSGVAQLKAVEPEVVVVVAFGEILTQEVLDVPAWGGVNLHFSLLPRWRGAAPVPRAILAGDSHTGVTTIAMDRGLDTGRVLLRREEPIRDDDTTGSLGARLATLGADVVVQTLEQLPDLQPIAQDETRATLATKIGPDERAIDWTDDAEAISRRIRALSPEPGATTRFRERGLKVLQARAAERTGEPGKIIDPLEVLVAAGRGAVQLREVVPEGRSPMPAEAWARGARLQVGQSFG